MNYMVMECHPSYAVLLDEEGRFLKAANLHYKTGQIVHDPVLMQEEPAKQRNLMRWARSGMAAAAACFLLLIGFNYYQNNVVSYSSIYLTINPEIQMDLNRKGSVTRLEGINEDGKTLLEGYDGKGKDKITVTDELIDRAIEMGFLSEGGQISFSIDAPDDALIQKYGEELQTEVLKYLENQFTITVEITNYQTGETESTQSTQPAPETATPETVAPAADDTDYGPGSDGVTDYNDTDYGPNNDGVTDYNDTDYGPNNDGVTDYNDTDYGPKNPYQRLPLPTAQITGIRIMMTEAAATATVTTMTAMITTAMMTMMMTTEIPFPCFHIQAGAALSVSACMYERQTQPPQTLL